MSVQDIEEIPLDSAEVMPGIMEESKADEEPAVEINDVLAMEITEKNKPKAKGRPKGSLNKGPSKPRATKNTNTRDACRGNSRVRAQLSQEKS